MAHVRRGGMARVRTGGHAATSLPVPSSPSSSPGATAWKASRKRKISSRRRAKAPREVVRQGEDGAARLGVVAVGAGAAGGVGAVVGVGEVVGVRAVSVHPVARRPPDRLF